LVQEFSKLGQRKKLSVGTRTDVIHMRVHGQMAVNHNAQVLDTVQCRDALIRNAELSLVLPLGEMRINEIVMLVQEAAWFFLMITAASTSWQNPELQALWWSRSGQTSFLQFQSKNHSNVQIRHNL
jgi:hypothetical protein